MRYAIVIERGKRNYSAYVPDLPGCVAAARTRSQVIRLMREGIAFHIEGMREDGDPVPEPTCSCETVEVDVPPARVRAPARPRRRTRLPA